MPRWLLVMLGVLVIGGIGLGAYLLGKDADDGDRPTVSTDANPDDDSASQPPPQSRVIKASAQGVTRVGEFEPQTGSPVEAAKVFGPPSYVDRNDELCVNEWRDLGLLINFADLGGADPCSAEGAVGSIEASGADSEQAGWETDEGARVGMSEKELRAIYPDAQEQSLRGLRNLLVLIEGPTVVGEGASSPVLSARIENATVKALLMSVGAAGE